jgi:toxin secretion/phage lysis holin
MKHNTDTLWTAIVGGSTASVAYLFGGLDNLLIALMIMMTLDYFTGISAALVDKKLSSKAGFKGLMKKGGMLSLVIVATQLDINFGTDNAFIRYAMIMYLIGIEGISLIENLGRLGVPVPNFLSDRFSQLKDKHNEGDK